MPRYITFFSYTHAAAKAMVDRPSDRTAAARALVESLGGRMESFYWMTGEHDGLVIASYPDSETAAALAVAAGSTGALHGMQTFELFDAEAQSKIVHAAKQGKAGYKPPTG